MNNETPTNETSTDILSESDITYDYATTGQRFLNYLIDNIFMRVGLAILTAMVISLLLGGIFPDFLDRVMITGSSEYWIFAGIMLIINYLFYYTVCERFFNGYTLGKLITGTRAVRLDGSPLRFKDALLRSLSRIVPFDPLSACFGAPWHDSWTNTTVIRSR